MAYLVRNARVHDVVEIVRLDRGSATAAHWSEKQYRELLAQVPLVPERLVLVSVEELTLVVTGFLIARHLSPEWELENIVVNSEVRGRGIGTLLITELVSRARSSQGENIFLEVRESNAAARHLYERVGFIETGRRKGYYSTPAEDAVLYSKTLGSNSLSR